MKWFDVKDNSLTFSLCLEGYSWEWGCYSLDSFELKEKGKMIFSCYGEPLLHDGYMVLRKSIDRFFNGEFKENMVTTIPTSPFEFYFYPDPLLLYPCILKVYGEKSQKTEYYEEYHRSEDYRIVRFTKDDLIRLRRYLALVNEYTWSAREMTEQGIVRLGYRWCIVGNIVETHEDEETHEIYFGTKQFSPNTKVFISPHDYHGKFEEHYVLGRNRRGHRFQYHYIPLKYITNLRVKKEYNPLALYYMEKWPSIWYRGTAEDKKKAEEFLQELKAKRNE